MSGSRPIEDYLDKPRRVLPGGRRFKRCVLSEVEDHPRRRLARAGGRRPGSGSEAAGHRTVRISAAGRAALRREDLTGGGVRTAARAMLAVSGVADTAFRFQRAEAVPSSPSTLVHAVFAAVRALITAAGGYFVVRAVLRLWSLRRLRTN